MGSKEMPGMGAEGNMFSSSFDPKVQALAYKVLHQYSGKSDLFEIVSRRIANRLGYIPTEFVPDQFELASSLREKCDAMKQCRL